MEKKNLFEIVKNESDAALAAASKEIEGWAKTGVLDDGVLRQFMKAAEPFPGCSVGDMLHHAETAVHREIARRFAALQHRQFGTPQFVVMCDENGCPDGLYLVKNWNKQFHTAYNHAVAAWNESDDEFFGFVENFLAKEGYEMETKTFNIEGGI